MGFNPETGEIEMEDFSQRLKEPPKSFLDKVKSVISKNPKARRYDADGKFYPDPVPMAPPVGFVQKPSIADQMRRIFHSEQMKILAAQEGRESFEEADDFEIQDEYDPRSPFEMQLEQELEPHLPSAPAGVARADTTLPGPAPGASEPPGVASPQAAPGVTQPPAPAKPA